MKKTFLILIFLFLPLMTLAQSGFELPPGNPITEVGIKGFLENMANFLIAIGVVGAVITIVAAGIMYFGHGFSANAVTKAKDIFRNALIGTLLVLGVGVIINTVSVFITGGFFGEPGPDGFVLPAAGNIGQECNPDGTCNSNNLRCKVYPDLSLCVRMGGNNKGENCVIDSDCNPTLECGQVVENGVNKGFICHERR